MIPLPGSQEFQSPRIEAYREMQKALRQLRKLEQEGDAEKVTAFIQEHLPLLAAHRAQWHELLPQERTFLLSEIERYVTGGGGDDTAAASSGGGGGTAKAVVSPVAQQQQQKGGHGGQGMAPK